MLSHLYVPYILEATESQPPRDETPSFLVPAGYDNISAMPMPEVADGLREFRSRTPESNPLETLYLAESIFLPIIMFLVS